MLYFYGCYIFISTYHSDTLWARPPPIVLQIAHFDRRQSLLFDKFPDWQGGTYVPKSWDSHRVGLSE